MNGPTALLHRPGNCLDLQGARRSKTWSTTRLPTRPRPPSSTTLTDGSDSPQYRQHTPNTVEQFNTGVTNMAVRPVSPGSTTSYDPAVTFTQPLKDEVNRFSVVRMMDNTARIAQMTNGNWVNRRPADYASQVLRPPRLEWPGSTRLSSGTETDKDACQYPIPATTSTSRNLLRF